MTAFFPKHFLRNLAIKKKTECLSPDNGVWALLHIGSKPYPRVVEVDEQNTS